MKTIALGVTSYWLQHAVVLLAAFVTSPIAVKALGADAYGLWTLMVSAAALFALLDLGIHSAVVRLISMRVARGERNAASSVFSTAVVMLIGLAVVALSVVVFAGELVIERFESVQLSTDYARAVIWIVAFDLAIGLVGAPYLAALAALQRFVAANLVTTVIALVKAIALILLLRSGAGMFALAGTQLAGTVLKQSAQIVLLRRAAPYLRCTPSEWSWSSARALASYGIWSLVASVATRVLLASDALIVGECLALGMVTFYSVPAALLGHVERLVLAANAVLLPAISASDARGDTSHNREMYVHGSRYAAFALIPMLVVSLVAGDEFLALWMGPELAHEGAIVLYVLAPAYFSALPQLVGHTVLRATGRHRVLAIVLVAQTLGNIVLSVLLARSHGLLGVAVGTAIPMVVASLIAIPLAACRAVGVGYVAYLSRGYAAPTAFAAALTALAWAVPAHLESYAAILLLTMIVTSLVAAGGWCFGLTREHRDRLRAVWSRRR